MDVEPSTETVNEMRTLLRFEQKYERLHPQKPLDIFYAGKMRYDVDPVFNKLRRSLLPYSIAQTFVVRKRLPLTVLQDFVDKHDGPHDWVYGKLNNPYDRGVDELFLNLYVIPAAEKLHYRIAYLDEFTIADGFFYFRQQLLQHPKTPELMGYIMGKEQPDAEKALDKFDKIFYTASKRITEEKNECTRRYWALLDHLVAAGKAWMPLPYMSRLLKNYRGCTYFSGLVTYVDGRVESTIVL
jgi:hypothetical protein